MAGASTYEELEIWQLARQQANSCYLMWKDIPGKDFALYDQMNASSGSVMDCIAEGFERSGNKEFRHFLIMAKGSNGEYRSQLYRCADRKYITPEMFELQVARNKQLGEKLMSLIKYLQKSGFKGHCR